MNNSNYQPNESREQYLYIKFALLVLAIGINGTIYSSIPFLFYKSNLDCIDELGEKHACTVEEACKSTYEISSEQHYPQLFGITQYLNLFCDRAILEVWILTAGTIGRVMANIILIIFPIKKESKELFMNICTFTIGVSLTSLQWISTVYMFMVAFFLWDLSFCLIYSVIFIYIAENFPKEIENYAIGIVNMAWPVTTIAYIFYTYYYGHWDNTLIHFTGIPCVIIAIISIILQYLSSAYNNPMQQNMSQIQIQQNLSNDIDLVQSPKQKEDSPLMEESIENIPNYTNDNQQQPQQNIREQVHEPKGVFYQYFPFMYYPKLRNNFLIWTLGFTCIGVSYGGVYYFLNLLEGNLFVNSLFSTLFEAVASIIATYLVVVFKDNLRNLAFLIFFITGIAFLSCVFFFNPDKKIEMNDNPYYYVQLFLVLFPIIVSKISFDMGWVVLVAYMKHIMPIQFFQQQFSCGNLVHAFAINCLPFYRYWCITYKYNPFIGLGLFSILSSFFTIFFEEIDEQQYQNIPFCEQHPIQAAQNKTQEEDNDKSLPQF